MLACFAGEVPRAADEANLSNELRDRSGEVPDKVADRKGEKRGWCTKRAEDGVSEDGFVRMACALLPQAIEVSSSII